MKHFTYIALLLILASSIIITGSCGSGEKKTQTDTLAVSTFGESSPGSEVFYQIPSPEELFNIIRDCKLTYSQSYINPITNISKYTDIRAKELNFGVYVADLAYTAAFQRSPEALKNIEAIRKMSEDIGIAAVFDEALKKRFKAMTENPDSLLSVTNSSYYKIVEYLDQNDRGRTLALTATGGWVESMYIIVNLTDKYSTNSKAIQRIADQKLTYENLMKYLEKQKSEPNVQSTITQLQGIGEIYNRLKNVEVKPSAKTGKKNVITVGGNTRIEMTEEQFVQFKQKITEIRNSITGN